VKILHIAEAFGGGVATAIEGYVRALPDVQHVVYGYRRVGHDVGDRIDEVATFHALPRGRGRQLGAIARAMRRERPDVVHAHSSFAGAFVRALPRRPGTAIVYTPHCFAFERTDIPGWLALGFRAIEQLLILRTDAVIANGPYEAGLASSLRTGLVSRSFPCLPVSRAVPRSRHRGGRLSVVTAGRVSAQKGVDWYCDTVAATTTLAAEAGIRPPKWTWLGAGDRDAEARIRAAGAEVSGWLPRDEIVCAMAGADAYLHTAAWEAGLALTLLEAAELGVPVVARRLRASDPWPIATFETPRGAASRLLQLHDADEREAASAASLALIADVRAAFDPAALRGTYEEALRATRRGLRGMLP
jgi:glycosyltransferase involved in cell wall biosynthesis